MHHVNDFSKETKKAKTTIQTYAQTLLRTKIYHWGKSTLNDSGRCYQNYTRLPENFHKSPTFRKYGFTPFSWLTMIFEVELELMVLLQKAANVQLCVCNKHQSTSPQNSADEEMSQLKN